LEARDRVCREGGVGKGRTRRSPFQNILTRAYIIELTWSPFLGNGVPIPNAEPSVAEPRDAAVVIVSKSGFRRINYSYTFYGGLIQGVVTPANPINTVRYARRQNQKCNAKEPD
jgi:hypothetical protein